MRVAILGGSFNPPHFGHLFFANEIRQKLKYDKIVFIPSAISAHKKRDNNITDNNRLEMIKLATKNLDWAFVSDCDISRGGITRSVDTINDIYKEFNLTSKPGFIIGDDLVDNFNNWKSPDIICNLSNLIIGVRDYNKTKLNYDYTEVKNRAFPLSSSEIRDRVNKGLFIDFLLPQEVIEYIDCNELYR